MTVQDESEAPCRLKDRGWILAGILPFSLPKILRGLGQSPSGSTPKAAKTLNSLTRKEKPRF